MNSIRTTLALAALLPVTLGAADAPPPAERAFDSVRQDLGALKSVTPGGVVPGPGLDLGAAAGISGSGNFATPPMVSAPARQPESAPTTQPAKSSGWLLDALEENSRKAGTGVSRKGGLDDPATADDKEPSDATGDAKDPARKTASTLPTAVSSPLSGYMSAWLSPDEFRRLGSLYPEMADGGPKKDALADPSNLRRFDGTTAAANGVTVQDAARIASGGAGPASNPNPFVQAMQTAPRSVTTVVPAAPPRPIPAPPASMASPVPEVAKPQTVVPEAAGADDRRYFPQLKRF